MKKMISDFKTASAWSEKTYATLPWRLTRSFYTTLVSEVMLQQTTVSTVKNRFENFVKKYPDFHSLAAAKDEDLLRLWQGLGYYSRAIRLKAAAQTLRGCDADKISVQELLKIPGVGDYTANALMAIGLNRVALAIDVNVERVLIRYFGIKKNTKSGEKTGKENVLEFFEKNVKDHIIDYRSFHETIMDVGRVFCQARSRNCMQCPMQKGCSTFRDNRDYYGENKKKVIKKKQVVEIFRLVVIKNKMIFLIQRKKGQWLSGQWEVPSIVSKGKIPLEQYPLNEERDWGGVKFKFSSTITHHHFKNKVVVMHLNSSKKGMKNCDLASCGLVSLGKSRAGGWFNQLDLKRMPLTSVMNKIIKKLL